MLRFPDQLSMSFLRTYTTKKDQSAGSKIGYSVCSSVTYDNNLSPEGCVILFIMSRLTISANRFYWPNMLSRLWRPHKVTRGTERERAQLKYLTTRTRFRQHRLLFVTVGASEWIRLISARFFAGWNTVVTSFHLLWLVS